MIEETIIALSTPPGRGGLGIVRLSGKKAYSIAKKIFKPKNNSLKEIPPRCPVLGRIINPENGEPFEEAFVTYFPAPNSYTREDVIEISCHGSPVVLEEIIKLGIKYGARLAKPGEFTLRAYLNGRIDLIQAEAVNDLINAWTMDQAKISFSQLEGNLSKKINNLREKLITLLSNIEAIIEFPEEGVEISRSEINQEIKNIMKFIQPLIESFDYGVKLKEGVKVVITGKPNVGKSSLFNALLQRERAIVTPYPGTTRDYLQERITIDGISFILFDTAGIEDSTHPIEVEGIQRGRRLIDEADGVLLLFDLSEKESEEDFQLIEKVRDKNVIFVFNKMDLPVKIDKEIILKKINGYPWLEISAKEERNLEKLKKLIRKIFIPDEKKTEEIILSLRQKILLEKVKESLVGASKLLEEGYSEEYFMEEARKAADYLGELTGKIKIDEILNEIFNNFCIGK
ncbi:tRNA uridine-5-carboxymethylaminomethyl(34) synthesis GTPase MnmE [SCandidatus Aminicenantes bacterium Aminicenantia_JdfR_composite]|jgi:tRNA modification GTPase|nr:tRNA uridine-5-carboxymethylaminomethyl(34) synthesis GTPase MnmE [SCandidatus Aminicenantes bacterium Aminicenantia_JdfR_composite]MCP2597578.1 tRNA uridine-5-carboxymethylaminomethyl(34) synthesis GTPase MnmE [Candidatus Aminicenantes bacterium AC-335-G13]MCP2597807.1 tRNA uridine-5-carboxymethylaminomethyl(34) synthesis GTPase MnmE [Candidatus Aminicenantes bacterium AC-335-L06]MCP2620532.1 tRNA uridine-5-carboxymethylaminomethyl(34) synthesis GTPase MnmE [Candidatus Aminicenantes bacteriu